MVDVYASSLFLSNPDAEEVSVADMSGLSVRLGSGASIAYKAPSKGVYVVSIGGKSIKVSL